MTSKNKNSKSNSKNQTSNILIFYYFSITICIITVLYSTNISYYTAYFIDYLWNRSDYTFKEEAQYNDNRIIQTDYFLTNFMNNYRNERLKNMPKIPALSISEIKINELTKENVMKISKKFTQPFIIRGLIRDFECVQKWDLNYFEKEYGDIEVLAFSDNKKVSYSKTEGTSLKKCNNQNNMCSIREICRGIQNGDPVYVNNISKLFTVSKQAEGELNLQKMTKIMNESFFNFESKCSFMSQLFLGGKNTGTSLHCASNINFFFNIKGSKHWGFIDPKYTSLINCQTGENGLFSVSDDDFFSESENNPFLKIPRYEGILNSGDFLFNPAWYWHAVKNKTDYTIAVANRYIYNYLFGEIPTISNNYFFSFLQLFSPSYYMQYVIKNDETRGKSTQEIYGNVVDKEILNNISNRRSDSTPRVEESKTIIIK